MDKVSRKILIITEGPPPLGGTIAEGGALRAWGLAKGLASHGLNVTLAYRSTFKLAEDSNKTDIPVRVTITTWDGEKISQLLDVHQIVIMRYAMGESWNIAQLFKQEHVFVADSYVPISVEVAARNSADKDEMVNYLRLQESSMLTMQRADYVLYASPAQLLYYMGYLSGINKLNPITYKQLDKRLFEVPYGVDPQDSPTQSSTLPSLPTLLWYGAFYSWFDMESLIPALLRLKETMPNFKLIVAGAKNPYNQDPGLLAHYAKTVKALSVLGDSIEYLPWSAFDKRFEIYAQGSAIITYNHTGLENSLAWRTRLMDFVLANRPIITNAGDPLGEDLIESGIAYRASVETLDEVFKQVIKTPPVTQNFEAVAEKYSWNKITQTLAKELHGPSRITDGPMELKKAPIKRFVKRVVSAPLRTYRYLNKNGIRKTLKRILGKA